MENEKIEAILSIILRAPSYFIIDYSYKNGLTNCIPKSLDWPDVVSSGFALFAVLQSFLILLLPLEKLVGLYMHYLTIAVLAGSDLFSQSYVKSEKLLMKQYPGYGTVSIKGFSNMLMLEKSLFDDDNDIEALFLRQNLSAIVFHIIVAILVTFFLDLATKKDKMYLLVYLLPILARLAGCPINDLHIAHNFASCFVIFITIEYIFLCLPSVFVFMVRMWMYAYHGIRIFSWHAFITVLFEKLFVPIQILIYWLVLYITQIYSHAYDEGYFFNKSSSPVIVNDTMENSLPSLQTLVRDSLSNGSVGIIGTQNELVGNIWYLIFVQSAVEVCVTPMMIIGLCVTVTYFAKTILWSAHTFTVGPGRFQEANLSYAMYSGLIMAVLIYQTSLLSSPLYARVGVFCLLLNIVCTNLVQNTLDLVEPLIISLSTQGIAPWSRHLRALLVMFLIFILPIYLVHSLVTTFDSSTFWLIIVSSSNLLTSVQSVGLAFTYILLNLDAACPNLSIDIDETIYYTKGFIGLLEVGIALVLVMYGVVESFIGHWSVFDSTIISIHAYFNVWQKVKNDWNNYLLRRKASSKISAMPHASAERLRGYNDICSVCHSHMTAAVVTNCNHLFHSNCLKKWLFIKDVCPLCSTAIRETTIEDEVGNSIPFDINEE